MTEQCGGVESNNKLQGSTRLFSSIDYTAGCLGEEPTATGRLNLVSAGTGIAAAYAAVSSFQTPRIYRAADIRKSILIKRRI